MYRRTQKKVHVLLHPELGDSHWDKAINAFLIILIILNVLVVMLETVPGYYDAYYKAFHLFDVFSVAIFSIEYLLRLWSCTHEKKYEHPVWGRLKYLVSLPAIIDLIAILPFYIHTIVGLDLRVLRMLRLFRFLRLFRLTAYMKAAKLVTNVFKAARTNLLLSLLLAITLIIVSSSLIYFIEHDAQPTVFKSIPDTLWWSIITLTTVGYGDMIPATTLGRVFTAGILLAGVALFALPAGIITAAFLEETRKQKKVNKNLCPHCNMPLTEDTPGTNVG